MQISSITSNSIQSTFNQSTAQDSVSKSLQSQISELQKELQELSEDDEMDTQTKLEKKQELQQQISNLNAQLRQHQMELKKQEQEKSQPDTSNNENKVDSKAAAGNSAFGVKSANALLSANNAVKVSNVQGSVAAKADNTASILETEIKLDGARGASTEYKQEQLSKAKNTAFAAHSGQFEALSKADKTLNEEAEEEEKTRESEKEPKTDLMYDKSGNAVSDEEEQYQFIDRA